MAPGDSPAPKPGPLEVIFDVGSARLVIEVRDGKVTDHWEDATPHISAEQPAARLMPDDPAIGTGRALANVQQALEQQVDRLKELDRASRAEDLDRRVAELDRAVAESERKYPSLRLPLAPGRQAALPPGAPHYVIVDVETTGFSFSSGHRIVEVAMVRLTPDGRVEREYTTLVNPECPMKCSSIHGIHDEDVEHAPTFRDIAGDVAAMMEGAVVVGHNVSFDYRFIMAELAAALEIEWEQDMEIPRVDTLQLARGAWPHLEQHKLDNCCVAAGIQREEAHHALDDARATALIFLQLFNYEKLFYAYGEVARPGWVARPPTGRAISRAEAALRARPHDEKKRKPRKKPARVSDEFPPNGAIFMSQADAPLVTFKRLPDGTEVMVPVKKQRTQRSQVKRVMNCTRCGTLHEPKPFGLYATFCAACTEKAKQDE
jgi:DNA polymerase III epsilon subunit family exonuclease